MLAWLFTLKFYIMEYVCVLYALVPHTHHSIIKKLWQVVEYTLCKGFREKIAPLSKSLLILVTVTGIETPQNKYLAVPFGHIIQIFLVFNWRVFEACYLTYSWNYKISCSINFQDLVFNSLVNLAFNIILYKMKNTIVVLHVGKILGRVGFIWK